jgi:hypothetical protein
MGSGLKYRNAELRHGGMNRAARHGRQPLPRSAGCRRRRLGTGAAGRAVIAALAPAAGLLPLPVSLLRHFQLFALYFCMLSA